MFTGLIEDVGEITAVSPRESGRVLTIRTAIPLGEVKIGDSIAVDGVCLTAESFASDRFTAVAGRETLGRSTLAHARAGRKVHLERAMQLGGRLGGHLVQGHVDGVGTIRRSYDAGESWILWVDVPAGIGKYIAEKGSLCVDGVSLTVNEIVASSARLNLVPHTAKMTRLGGTRPGDAVNLEVDIIAKYVERLLGGGGGGLDVDSLRKWGYPV